MRSNVRGHAPETWVWLAVISDHVEMFSNYQVVRQLSNCASTRWLGTISIDAEGNGEGNGEGGGDKVGGVGGNSVASTRVSSVLTNACNCSGLLPSVLSIRTADLLWVTFGRQFICVASDTAPALSLQRVPSSSSTVQGVPLAPLLSSLSYVNSFDTAPPPQDL
ncbi:uncharacterized protein UDID_18758 [Ustilago sp. UG-2017a]|nr:uncharacterized protein UDID_18758 [Ustilago sp. UG-2017a]